MPLPSQPFGPHASIARAAREGWWALACAALCLGGVALGAWTLAP